eukprot:TRINITY_DN111572_c0_g1_i1.p1 TRINITY_DN111572_c0_g1~~TRINITY_DN111572_c0_g1_i1.p1  ORF type:complete len:251 (+),score=52.11 TRINITY_DN111572_c0_g1_i1:96-755(+)
MAPLKFTYFPVMAKGLGPSICLEVSGLEWEGTSQVPAEWPALKPQTPFGQLPILEMPEGLVISEMCAIINVIGRKKPEMQGADDVEFAVSQMLMQFGEDLYNTMQKFQDTVFAKDKCPKEETEKMWAETVPGHMAKLEALIQKYGKGNDRFTASGMTVGELSLFAYLYQMKLVNDGMLSSTPSLSAFFQRIASDERVKKVIETGSKMGTPFNQYFVARA